MTDWDLNIYNMCRFESVAEISDVSNLNIEIKTDTRLLSPNVVYGVYLLFKLCDSRKVSTKPMYVNLKYRVGSEKLHAYFAKQREEEWMTIELYRFLNQKEDGMLTFLLESCSSHYCGDSAIYVEGIEFRAIDKVSMEIYLGSFSILLFVLHKGIGCMAKK